MSPEYLVINCRFWDGTSDYYDRLINLAEDYLDKTDEPTVTGFNNYIIYIILAMRLRLKVVFFCFPGL